MDNLERRFEIRVCPAMVKRFSRLIPISLNGTELEPALGSNRNE